MGLFFEGDLQRALLEQQWIIDIANFAYMNSHFVVTTVFLVWLYLYRNDSYYFVRNMFMVAMGLALVGYTLMPTAPPRFFESSASGYARPGVGQPRLGAGPDVREPLRGHTEHALRVRPSMIGASGARSPHTISRACVPLSPPSSSS